MRFGRLTVDGPSRTDLPVSADAGARPAFAHASEAELARILDFYQVRWTYEPDTFPIGWSMSGEVVESFSPDFYLPDLDLYVELDHAQAEAGPQEEPQAAPAARAVSRTSGSSCSTRATSGCCCSSSGGSRCSTTCPGTTGQATPPRTADRIVLEAGLAPGRRAVAGPCGPLTRRTTGARWPSLSGRRDRGGDAGRRPPRRRPPARPPSAAGRRLPAARQPPRRRARAGGPGRRGRHGPAATPTPGRSPRDRPARRARAGRTRDHRPLPLSPPPRRQRRPLMTRPADLQADIGEILLTEEAIADPRRRARAARSPPTTPAAR